VTKAGILVSIRVVIGELKEIVMRALTARATVHPNHLLTLQVPADIPAGVHQVVVVLQESAPLVQNAQTLTNWPAHKVGLVEPGTTFRREDIYGDDGR